jgi:hypothetical protein
MRPVGVPHPSAGRFAEQGMPPTSKRSHCMTPWDFYHEFVLQNFWMFKEDRGSIFKAFNAAIAAFQLADHFYKYLKKTRPDLVSVWRNYEEFLIHLGKIEPAFVTVQTIATAYKHLYLYAAPHYEASSAGALRAITSRELSFGDPGDDREEYPPEKVVLKRKDGTTVEFYDCLRQVVNMWPKLLSPR